MKGPADKVGPTRHIYWSVIEIDGTPHPRCTGPAPWGRCERTAAECGEHNEE